jgi:hypothetical protein
VIRRLALAAALLAVAADPAVAIEPPPGEYHNVEFVNELTEPANGAVAINFIRYDSGTEVMFVSASSGLYAYDVTRDPANPVLLGKIDSADLRQPTDTADSFFQNEDMDVDPRRKLVFMARDVTSHGTGNPGVYIIDAKDPANLEVIVFHPLPEGHTTTCVNECSHLWSAGLLLRREIFVTDITDPANPVTSPLPVDVGPFDMPAGSSHDVAVDAAGVAWVSGQGYLRGYWTKGNHPDPLTGAEREATPTEPVLYGGGKVPSAGGGPSDQGRFLHGSFRPIGPTAGHGAPNFGGYGEGNLIYAAEEAYGACPVGPFVISSLKGALDTTALGDLETVGLWTPAEQEGMGAGECSAHWFTMREGLVAHGWYAQGTRFIDVRDPHNPVQVGYARPDDATTSAAYWHGPYVYVADYSRGVDILRFTGGDRAVPPTTAPGGTCQPTAALAQRGLRLTRRFVRLRGSATCLSRGARVEVALARVRAGRCRFLDGRGRIARRAGACSRPIWLRPRGAVRWTLARRARLPRGSYSAFIRATGGPIRRYRLEADRRGRARATEDVAAPPRD